MLWNYLTRCVGFNQGQTQYRMWVDAVFRHGLELASDGFNDRPAIGDVGSTRLAKDDCMARGLMDTSVQ